MRDGTLSLYAARNTRAREVLGRTANEHTSKEFVAFLAILMAAHPRRREIHVILDDLSNHKTRRVEEFFALHPNVHLHFTPTYSSSLNQGELWFKKLERDVIDRCIFTSTADLRRKLMRYIRAINRNPKTIKWSYADPSRRIPSNHSAVTVPSVSRITLRRRHWETLPRPPEAHVL